MFSPLDANWAEDVYVEMAYVTTKRVTRRFLHTKALKEIPCPDCQAQPGQGCRYALGWRSDRRLHPLRIIAASFIYGDPVD